MNYDHNKIDDNSGSQLSSACTSQLTEFSADYLSIDKGPYKQSIRTLVVRNSKTITYDTNSVNGNINNHIFPGRNQMPYIKNSENMNNVPSITECYETWNQDEEGPRSDCTGNSNFASTITISKPSYSQKVYFDRTKPRKHSVLTDNGSSRISKPRATRALSPMHNVIQMSEKTTCCRPGNSRTEHYMHRVADRYNRLRGLVKQILEAREREKQTETWNNYINELKLKYKFHVIESESHVDNYGYNFTSTSQVNRFNRAYNSRETTPYNDPMYSRYLDAFRKNLEFTSLPISSQARASKVEDKKRITRTRPYYVPKTGISYNRANPTITVPREWNPRKLQQTTTILDRDNQMDAQDFAQGTKTLDKEGEFEFLNITETTTETDFHETPVSMTNKMLMSPSKKDQIDQIGSGKIQKNKITQKNDIHQQHEKATQDSRYRASLVKHKATSTPNYAPYQGVRVILQNSRTDLPPDKDPGKAKEVTPDNLTLQILEPSEQNQQQDDNFEEVKPRSANQQNVSQDKPERDQYSKEPLQYSQTRQNTLNAKNSSQLKSQSQQSQIQPQSQQNQYQPKKLSQYAESLQIENKQEQNQNNRNQQSQLQSQSQQSQLKSQSQQSQSQYVPKKLSQYSGSLQTENKQEQNQNNRNQQSQLQSQSQQSQLKSQSQQSQSQYVNKKLSQYSGSLQTENKQEQNQNNRNQQSQLQSQPQQNQSQYVSKKLSQYSQSLQTENKQEQNQNNINQQSQLKSQSQQNQSQYVPKKLSQYSQSLQTEDQQEQNQNYRNQQNQLRSQSQQNQTQYLPKNSSHYTESLQTENKQEPNQRSRTHMTHTQKSQTPHVSSQQSFRRSVAPSQHSLRRSVTPSQQSLPQKGQSRRQSDQFRRKSDQNNYNSIPRGESLQNQHQQSEVWGRLVPNTRYQINSETNVNQNGEDEKANDIEGKLQYLINSINAILEEMHVRNENLQVTQENQQAVETPNCNKFTCVGLRNIAAAHNNIRQKMGKISECSVEVAREDSCYTRCKKQNKICFMDAKTSEPITSSPILYREIAVGNKENIETNTSFPDLQELASKEIETTPKNTKPESITGSPLPKRSDQIRIGSSVELKVHINTEDQNSLPTTSKRQMSESTELDKMFGSVPKNYTKESDVSISGSAARLDNFMKLTENEKVMHDSGHAGLLLSKSTVDALRNKLRKHVNVCECKQTQNETNTFYTMTENYINKVNKSCSNFNEILDDEMRKSMEAKKEINALINEELYTPCGVQINIDIPCRDISTEVTSSLAKTAVTKKDRGSDIESKATSMLFPYQTAASVNTEHNNNLYVGLWRVSSVAIKGLLSMVPFFSNLPLSLGTVPELATTSRNHTHDQFICNICGATFTTTAALSQHVEKHSLSGAARDCCVCRHYLTLRNSGIERNFSCRYCGQCFLRAYCCELHMQNCARKRGIVHDVRESLITLS